MRCCRSIYGARGLSMSIIMASSGAVRIGGFNRGLSMSVTFLSIQTLLPRGGQLIRAEMMTCKVDFVDARRYHRPIALVIHLVWFQIIIKLSFPFLSQSTPATIAYRYETRTSNFLQYALDIFMNKQDAGLGR